MRFQIRRHAHEITLFPTLNESIPNPLTPSTDPASRTLLDKFLESDPRAMEEGCRGRLPASLKLPPDSDPAADALGVNSPLLPLRCESLDNTPEGGLKDS